ncbi:MAG: diacylglycerol kinase family protein, partial [Candidatus Sulfotelmatobacter sp.]
MTAWTRPQPDFASSPTASILLLSTAHMRAAAILGLGCSPKSLKPFQTDKAIEWRIGLPASSHEVDIILLFGGDGTIHRHLSQLVKLALPVLVVPAGSGNDFARALGLRSVRDSLAEWGRFCAGQSNVKEIDLGIITPLENAGGPLAPHELPSNSVLGTQRYFCSVAGVGLDSEVSRRANMLPRWLRGHGGYALTLVPMIFRFAPVHMKITASTEGGDWIARSDQPTILTAFANTAIYGGGMKIAPHAKVDDGQLDVCVVGGVDPFKLACMFPTVYFGRHLRIREVDYFQAVRLRLETETPLEIHADGEYVCCTPAEIRVQPGVLRVVASTSQAGLQNGSHELPLAPQG